jgi:tRNA modification GTPase
MTECPNDQKSFGHFVIRALIRHSGFGFRNSRMVTGDTIVAISSSVGPAARMIVRLSGPQATTIAQHVLTEPYNFPASAAARLRFRVRDLPSFPGWLYSFRSPKSVTGEDVIELHIPGNPLLARMLLDDLIKHGARQADPGEFTARAYFNGRIDLAQAEGVAATIAAQSDAQLQAARQLLGGELARRLRPAMDSIAETLGLVEVGIDFSEEDVTFLSSEQIVARLDSADRALDDLLRDSARFEDITHEPQIVLVGRPNAGKSTLLNALAGEERAIVSPVAGTTRDAIWAHVTLPHGVVRIIDVAGIEKSASDRQCHFSGTVSAKAQIDHQMQQRAQQTLETADRIILVIDPFDSSPPPNFSRMPDLIVYTKSDLSASAAAVHNSVSVSALTGGRMTELCQQLDRLAFEREGGQALTLNSRHLQCIATARDAIARARELAQSNVGQELLAMELREALDTVGQILGQVTPDDVLGRVFAAFCIGK